MTDFEAWCQWWSESGLVVLGSALVLTGLVVVAVLWAVVRVAEAADA